MSKFVKYLSIFLFVVSAVLAVAFYLKPAGKEVEETMVEIVLYYAYVLFGLAVILAIGLPFISLVDNPKKFKRIFINLAAVVVVFGLGYILASGAPLPKITTEIAPTANVLKLTDTGLIVTYLLIAASVLAILSGGIINMVRNR